LVWAQGDLVLADCRLSLALAWASFEIATRRALSIRALLVVFRKRFFSRFQEIVFQEKIAGGFGCHPFQPAVS